MLPKKESDALKVREESKQDKTDVPSDELLQEIKRTAAGINPSPLPPTLLVWSSQRKGVSEITIMDLETQQSYQALKGIKMTFGGRTFVKEIPNTRLFVFLKHQLNFTANLEVYDASIKGKVKKIYSSEEIFGVTGFGDVAYNSRRGILGAVAAEREIGLHLWNIGYCGQKSNFEVKLLKQMKWHPEYNDEVENCITSFDFNPSGETLATIDDRGVCLISDLNTDKYIFHLNMDDDNSDCTFWIDVCPVNGNLVASGGKDENIKIFDKRNSKIVKIFDAKNSKILNCVRWSPSGDMLAAASRDNAAKLFDFNTGKVLYTGSESNGSVDLSVCFL